MVGGKKQEPKKTEMEMVTRRNETEKSMWYSGLSDKGENTNMKMPSK